jgi:pyrroline-5-carboxylate reductase
LQGILPGFLLAHKRFGRPGIDFDLKIGPRRGVFFMFEQTQVGFIGGGNMGEALIKGFLSSALLPPGKILVHDVSPERMHHLATTYGIRLQQNIPDLVAASQIIIVAVKPQVMQTVVQGMRPHLGHAPLVISIAAGIPLDTLTSAFPADLPVVRVMPNTPALVLQGASALSRGPGVTDTQMEQALTLFKAVGKAMEVEEKWMDAVTGLSGSGPAYFLLLLEGMIDAGVLMGLPRPVARELVLQTARGTVEMVFETGKHPAELKDMITSPGGTTIRGLHVLEERSVRGALMRAVEAATNRSRELGKG